MSRFTNGVLVAGLTLTAACAGPEQEPRQAVIVEVTTPGEEDLVPNSTIGSTVPETTTTLPPAELDAELRDAINSRMERLNRYIGQFTATEDGEPAEGSAEAILTATDSTKEAATAKAEEALDIALDDPEIADDQSIADDATRTEIVDSATGVIDSLAGLAETTDPDGAEGRLPSRYNDLAVFDSLAKKVLGSLFAEDTVAADKHLDAIQGLMDSLSTDYETAVNSLEGAELILYAASVAYNAQVEAFFTAVAAQMEAEIIAAEQAAANTNSGSGGSGSNGQPAPAPGGSGGVVDPPNCTRVTVYDAVGNPAGAYEVCT